MTRRTALLLSAAIALTLGLAACSDEGSGAAAPPDASGGADTAVAQRSPGRAVPAEGVTVTGQGRVTGEPDTVRATVGVHVVRDSVDQAFADATAAAQRVIDALRERGVAEEDIQTRELSLRPEHERRPEEQPRVVGYVVRNLVEVTIHDVDRAGDLLAAVADAGGDDARVQGLRFSLEDNDAQLEAARAAAFEDARAKAEHYAELAGRELGPLMSVSEVSAQAPPPVPMPTPDVAERGGAAPIMPGQQEVGVRLQAVWSLR